MKFHAKPVLAALASVLLAGACAVHAGGIPTLDVVTVTGADEGLIGTAATATEGTVTAEQLENRPMLRPAEVLEAVPGLIVSQHSGDGKANQYYLRGFNLDHGTDFAVSIDGMPVNMPSHAHGQGYADLNFLMPELVEREQYRKGTYAAEQGDFSAAGSVNIELFRSLSAPFADIGFGENGYRRGLLAGSPEAGGGRLLYALEWMANDGPWKLPEDLNKLNGLLRYSRGTRDNGWSATLMAYRADWDATDQVPLRAIESGLLSRFGFIDPSDGGKSHRNSLSGNWSSRSDSGWSRANAYAIDYGLNLFSDFTYNTDPVHGDQFEQYDDRKVYGLNAAHTWYGSWAGRAVDTTVGLQSRYDRIGKIGLYLTSDRVRWDTIREDRVDEGSVALYAESQVQWQEKFRSILGLRGDFYHFDVSSDLPKNSGKVDDQMVSPKLSLIFGPWSGTEYYVNAGYGFHSNDARGITTTVNPDFRDSGYLSAVTPATALVRAKGYELGLRSAILPHLQTTLALWQLELASELVFAGDSGTTQPSAPSRRLGLEWANFWKPTSAVTVDADLALSRSRFSENVTGSYLQLGDISGRYIPGSIEKMASVGATHDDGGAWSGGARLRYFGPRPLVENDSARSKASTLVNLQIAYKYDKRAKLTLEVLNVFDANVSDIDYYYDYQLPGQAATSGIVTHPAEPRTVRMTFRMKL